MERGPALTRARAPAPKPGWLLAAGADDGEDVAGRQDEVLLALDLDLGAAVLGVDDLVADRDVEGDAVPVLEPARAYRHDGALHWLLLRRVGDHEARRGHLFALVRLHDDPVLEGPQTEVLRHARSSLCLL